MTWLALGLIGCVTQATVGTPTGSTGTATGQTGPRTCTQVEAEYAAELASIQSCTEHEECGQVLEGTSCGCTRDLVARIDADLARWEALTDEAIAKQCEIGGTSVCDCPPAEGFRCVEGLCSWNYVDPSMDGLPACRADQGDPTEILELAVREDALIVGVAYSGGCAEHEFTLCWPEQAFQESNPVGARLELLHDANGDACEAWIREERTFELFPLQQRWHAQYGDGPGVIAISVGDLTARYDF